MSTARQIINRAASLIGVKRANVDLPDDDLEAGLDQLRDWLVERQIAGVKFPAMYPADLDSELHEPDWTRSYIKSSIGMRLAAEFTQPISGELVMMAKQAQNAVYQRLFSEMEVELPDTLPIGQGNMCYGDYWNNFYLSSYNEALKTATNDLVGDGEGRLITYETTPGTGRNIVRGGP